MTIDNTNKKVIAKFESFVNEIKMFGDSDESSEDDGHMVPSSWKEAGDSQDEPVNNKWAIFAGLGGGFGGANFTGEVFTGTKEQAESRAYGAAQEEYDSYEGSHGLRSINDIMDEDGVDEEEAIEIYNEERESWLDYWVEPYDPKNHR